MFEQPILTTDRLTLRPFALKDARDVQRLAGAWDVAAMTAAIPHPYEDGMAEAWIETHARDAADGKILTYAITLAETGELCGAIDLRFQAQDRKAGMGYWIGKPYWNRGYCTEAARVLVDHAFRKLGLNRVYAVHLARNPASGRVMQKLGMKHEGTLRKDSGRWGVFEDVEAYGILASEWRADSAP